MNTPKLSSILSSSIGAAVPSRLGKAADPAHGLDFSRLLGEKHSQAATPAATGRPFQNDAGRSRSADAQPRVINTPARQDDARRDAPLARNTSTAEGGVSSARDNPGRTDRVAARDGQPNHQASTDAAGPSPSDATDSSRTQASGDTSQGAANTGAAEQGAQLAQAAAESGLPALAASLAVQAVPLTQEGGTNSRLPAATAQAAAVGQTGADAAALVQGVAALPGLDAELEVDLDAAQAQRLIAGQAGAAATPASQVQAAVAQAFNGIDAAAANRASTAAAPPAASHIAAETLPSPLAAETAGSAAALSLQDFTAMVAAARATSGTALSPVASLATPGVAALPPAAMAGLAPAGLMPGQATAAMAAGGIRAPLSSPQWPTELGRQFISIAQAGKGLGQVAELRLDPPELGPLRITINLNDNVAHAVFSSPHALVRQTVENALPQLQQMLEQAGISLGQANVSDQHQSGQASHDQAAHSGRQADASGTGAATDDAAGTDVNRQGRSADPNALVDTFA